MPRSRFQKTADGAGEAVTVGLAPRVSLRIAWDRVEDYGALATHAEELGVRIGAINSTCSRRTKLRLARSPTPTDRVRAKAVAGIQVMREPGRPT